MQPGLQSHSPWVESPYRKAPAWSFRQASPHLRPWGPARASPWALHGRDPLYPRPRGEPPGLAAALAFAASSLPSRKGGLGGRRRRLEGKETEAAAQWAGRDRNGAGFSQEENPVGSPRKGNRREWGRVGAYGETESHSWWLPGEDTEVDTRDGETPGASRGAAWSLAVSGGQGMREGFQRAKLSGCPPGGGQGRSVGPPRPPALEPDKRPFFGEGRRERLFTRPGKERVGSCGQGVGCMLGFRMEGAGRGEEEA